VHTELGHFRYAEVAKHVEMGSRRGYSALCILFWGVFGMQRLRAFNGISAKPLQEAPGRGFAMWGQSGVFPEYHFPLISVCRTGKTREKGRKTARCELLNTIFC